VSETAATLRLVVITASDRAAAGAYADVGGDTAQELAETFLRGDGFVVTTTRILLPDGRARLAAAIAGAAADGVDLVLTTGGTGLGPRAGREILAVLLPLLPHAVAMARGGGRHPH
jgi:molybdenum cofactor biosynthesis protein B